MLDSSQNLNFKSPFPSPFQSHLVIWIHQLNHLKCTLMTIHQN